jgi:hypothetical protein
LHGSHHWKQLADVVETWVGHTNASSTLLRPSQTITQSNAEEASDEMQPSTVPGDKKNSGFSGTPNSAGITLSKYQVSSKNTPDMPAIMENPVDNAKLFET